MPFDTARLRAAMGYQALRHFGWAIVPALCARDAVRGSRDVPVSEEDALPRYPSADHRHLVIVTPRGERESETWQPGGGNYFYELLASAQETYGSECVEIFLVDEDAAPSTWHALLIQHLVSVRASHCLGFVESDPGQAGPWHWNAFARQAQRTWPGTFIGILTDGVYLLHQVRATRFRRAMPRSVFIAIDIAQSRFAGFVPKHTIFGPCFLPISNASVDALNDTSEGNVERQFDLVFVGKVYANREGFLDELRSSGIRVGINPHRPSPEIRPGYADYVRGLRQGHFTLNLSEAGGTPVPQLKSRMLEGPLFGTLVCTDETELGRRFFETDQFVVFSTAHDLKEAIAPLLADPQQLDARRSAAQARARELASRAFWETTERGLAENDLPAIGALPRR